ncbi:MAG: (2Fe-2S)-binding protein [Bacillota bacterium]|nr:(2Fe-2S)-binding protein [Bacillota bacterium]
MKATVCFSLNGEKQVVEVDPSRTLLDVIRTDLSLTGTKKGCGDGDCGGCTVLIDGVPYNSCLVLIAKVEGKEVTTIEGLEKNGQMHPIQEAFVNHGAIQCGFCTPGMIMSAKYILDKNPKPTENEIRQGISGNLCRCTGYQKIVEAIGTLAGKEV